MKFGEQLRSSIIREYQWYYIDYDGLKAELKKATGPPSSEAPNGREWTEDDERRFVEKLETELEKVHTKQQVKAMEISRRIAVSEREVKDVVNRLNERGLDETGPNEEEFMLLEEDLSDIIADVHDLAKFVQLNYTGFYKIIKKHDVSASLTLTCPCHTWLPVLTRHTETNGMAPATCIRDPTQGQAFLQGELRQLCGAALQAVRSGSYQRKPSQG